MKNDFEKMSDSVVENQICKSCSAEIRKGALFCYHCGSSVVSELITAKKIKENQAQETVSEVTDKTEINEEPESEKNHPESAKVIKAQPKSARAVEENQPVKVETKSETNLKSAASLRKRNKPAVNKKVEIVWEEYENAPNGWFLLAVIFFGAFAFALLFLALYLK